MQTKSASMERLSRTNGALKKSSNIFEVVIIKVANKGLGLGLASHGTLGSYDYAIYLKYIAKGSPTPVKGDLRLKDVVLSINKEKVRSKCVEEVQHILRTLPPGPVDILIKRTTHSSSDIDSDGSAHTNTTRPTTKAKPGKENQRNGLINSHGSESDKGSHEVRASRSLNRSRSVDGGLRLSQKHNWFNYEDRNGAKKAVFASKGSLGIDYGQNENMEEEYGSLSKRNADKRSRDSSLEKKKVIFDEENLLNAARKSATSNRRNADNQRNNSSRNSAQQQLASILSSSKENLLSTKISLDASASRVSEVPKGMEPHVVDIVKDEKVSLGISLVPAVGNCVGLFQIRFIFPGTAAANNGMVFIGDVIFSVNGIKLYNVTHPQAIHILKKCVVKCKLIVFREVNKRKDTNTGRNGGAEKEEKGEDQKKKRKKEEDEMKDVLPGTIVEKEEKGPNKTLLNSLVLPSVPSLDSLDIKKVDGKPTKEAKLEMNGRSTFNGERSEEEEEDCSDAADSAIKEMIPECVCTNKRTKNGPFLIEHLKANRMLGVNVMMDEEGQCVITKVALNGSIYNDKRIRVGDVVIAVNDQLLSGKPISDVKSIIRSLPKGIIRFVLKAGEVDEEQVAEKLNKKFSPPSKISRGADAVSIASSNDDDKSERLSTASFIAIPPDNSEGASQSKPTTLPKPPPPPALGIPLELYAGFSDDMSDVASLPPAPPRPSFVPQKLPDALPPAPPRPFVPQNMMASLGSHIQHLTSVKEFDAVSDVSSLLPPAPPVPATPRVLISQSADIEENDVEDDDSDVGSLYSYIPAPPPPLLNKKQTPTTMEEHSTFGGSSQGPEEVEPPVMEDVLSYPMIDDQEGSEFDMFNVDGYVHLDQVDRAMSGLIAPPPPVPPPAFNSAAPNFDMSTLGLTNQEDDVQSSTGSHESLSVYNDGVVVYNENKQKKSLLSKLRNKMVLPSKNSAKEYSDGQKEEEVVERDELEPKTRSASDLRVSPRQSPKAVKEKRKKKKDRPNSMDLTGKSQRDAIKASISQPDLTSMSSHEVDIMFKKRGSTDNNAIIRSIAEEWSIQSKLEDEEEEEGKVEAPDERADTSHTSQLPRILSFRKKSNEKRNRKKTSASNISPPRSPAPPPPAEFVPVDPSDNETDDVSDFIVPTNDRPAQFEVVYPEKLISGGNFAVEDACGAAKTLSESSSSIPGSYAAFGPTIISANATMDNFESPYNVIGEQEEVDVNWEKENSVFGNENVETDAATDAPYETIEEITSKLKPLTYGTPPKPTDDKPCSSKLVEDPNQRSGFPYADPALSSTLTRDGVGVEAAQNTAQLMQHADLSEKDKYDPKLQPFIMSQGISDLLHTWPSETNKFLTKTPSSPYSDYDDDGWGSEFSSNVLDYSGTPEARTYPVNNSFDGTMSRSLDQSQPEFNPYMARMQPRPPIGKSKSFKNFFMRGNRGEEGSEGAEGRGSSAALPDKMVIEHVTHNRSGEINVSPQTTSKKNPVAKPPRRLSSEQIQNNMNETYYENIENYARPMYQSETCDPKITPEKHQQLYAAIDFTSKMNRRPSSFEYLKDPDQDVDYRDYGSSMNRTNSENGYTSDDATVYSLPERNNSPSLSRIDVTKIPHEDGGYASVNSVYQETVEEEDDEDLEEGIFTIQFTRPPGGTIGISLIGGVETALKKCLIKGVDEESVTNECHIPLREGDELMEINGISIQECTHAEVLHIIRECPSIIEFKLHRSVDGNVHLLQQQQASDNIMKRKVQSEKAIQALTASQSDLYSLTPETPRSNHSNSNYYNNSADAPTLTSFEPPPPEHTVAHRLTRILASRPPAPHQFSHVGSALPPVGPGGEGGIVESECGSNTPPPEVQGKLRTSEGSVVTFLDVDLHKETGRGLGISVVGGPKHVINNGIKVKRLAPGSIADTDGRLQKDDRIIAINGTRIKGMSQGDALNILKNIRDTVVLTICRTQDPHNGVAHAPEPPYEENQDVYDHTDNGSRGIMKSNSEACLPTAARQSSTSTELDGSVEERQSRSKTKKTRDERSQSETRELKRKTSTRSRSRSPGIFSRIFRSSSRTSLGDAAGRKSKANSADEVRHTYPHTLYFDKTSDSLDFKLNRKSQGGEHTIVVHSVRKDSLLFHSLFVGDVVLSINGISVRGFSEKDLKKFLRTLPIGAIPMVVQRT